MRLLRLHSVFSKLFVSVMLALILFTVAMIFLTKVVQDSNNSMRSEILAGQVIEQINPFLYDLNDAPNRLQSRFMLAVIKKSFDIFDESLDAKMGLYDIEGRLLIQTEGSDLAKQLPEPPTWFVRTFPTLAGVSPTASARVFSPAGYTLFFEPRQSPKHNALTAMFNLFTGTILLLMMMGIALWWIARSMTWRINQMSKRMAQLGEGDFSVRVPVKGDDEIATLAKGFNQSAEKVEKLINANNLLLAHASHEFRTPITRIRLQVEMMDMIAEQLPDNGKSMFTKRAKAITRDLTGLNDLIESILLVSRLDAGHALQQVERLDIYQLIQQETQHYPEATLYGEHVIIQGQPQLLTHLIRNLLNNAMIHGVPPMQVYLYSIEKEAQAPTIPESLLTITSDDNTTKPIDHHLEPTDDGNGNANPNALAHISDMDAVATDADTGTGMDIVVTNTNTADTSDSQHQSTASINQPASPNNESAKSKAKRPPLTAKFPTPKLTTAKLAIPTPRLPTRNRTAVKTKPKFVVLAVVDQGEGIPKDKQEDIFSPFVRLKQEKKGSGLGLSLVAQIVEAHNGQIVTDTWQGHTRFLVTLPIKAKSSVSISE